MRTTGRGSTRRTRMAVGCAITVCVLTAGLPAVSAPATARPDHKPAPGAARPGRRPAAAPAAGASAAAAARALNGSGIIAGTVDGPAAMRLAGICVRATGPGGPRLARTTAGGRFIIPALRPGPYTVALDTCDATGAYLPQSYPGRVLVQPGVPTELAPAALTAATTAQALATERA